MSALGVGAAQFFTNALDTSTVGADVVVESSHLLGNQLLRWSVAGRWRPRSETSATARPTQWRHSAHRWSSKAAVTMTRLVRCGIPPVLTPPSRSIAGEVRTTVTFRSRSSESIASRESKRSFMEAL